MSPARRRGGRATGRPPDHQRGAEAAAWAARAPAALLERLADARGEIWKAGARPNRTPVTSATRAKARTGPSRPTWTKLGRLIGSRSRRSPQGHEDAEAPARQGEEEALGEELAHSRRGPRRAPSAARSPARGREARPAAGWRRWRRRSAAEADGRRAGSAGGTGTLPAPCSRSGTRQASQAVSPRVGARQPVRDARQLGARLPGSPRA